VWIDPVVPTCTFAKSERLSENGQVRDLTYFELGARSGARLREPMLSAVVVEQHVTTIDLSAWPRWLVVLCATLVLALAIWIGMKLLKLTLWLLFYVVLIGGICWAAWLLVKAM
jgi:hypothetical protein